MAIISNGKQEQFTIPILFMVFNRPEITERTFNQIRQQRPLYLYIEADGYRMEKEGEREKCEQVRAIVKNIDWPCTPKYLFRDMNLGCDKACKSAIDWFFNEIECGIIIEDDCLPDPSFFPYCEELLDRYKKEEKIMMISGTNLKIESGTSSYYFSKYGQIWGWATWKRAWIKYEPEMDINNKKIQFNTKDEDKYWRNNFATRYWDPQWAVYTMWLNKSFAILPNRNLVTNIGFGKEATHYDDENSITAGIATKSMEFPMKHPREIVVDNKVDNEFFYKFYYQSFYKRLYNILRAGPKEVIKKILGKIKA